MEEKGKTVIIDSNEEAEESPTYIEEVNLDEDPIQPMQQPKYVPPSKGKVKVPAKLDEVNTVIITLSLPKAVPVENSVVGCVATMKFEDWDLVDIVKFPHLVMDALMEWNVEGTMTML